MTQPCNSANRVVVYIGTIGWHRRSAAAATLRRSEWSIRPLMKGKTTRITKTDSLPVRRGAAGPRLALRRSARTAKRG